MSWFQDSVPKYEFDYVCDVENEVFKGIEVEIEVEDLVEVRVVQSPALIASTEDVT